MLKKLMNIGFNGGGAPEFKTHQGYFIITEKVIKFSARNPE